MLLPAAATLWAYLAKAELSGRSGDGPVPFISPRCESRPGTEKRSSSVLSILLSLGLDCLAAALSSFLLFSASSMACCWASYRFFASAAALYLSYTSFCWRICSASRAARISRSLADALSSPAGAFAGAPSSSCLYLLCLDFSAGGAETVSLPGTSESLCLGISCGCCYPLG